MWRLTTRLHFALARPKLLLAVPALLYVLAAISAHQRGDDEPSGDEVHYLQVAESIVRDFDFNLENNHEQFGPLPGNSHCLTGKHGWFSVHNLGLPALIAAPWAVGGLLGARLIVALLAGLAAPVLYHVIEAIWRQPRASLVMALALSLSMPMLHASRQIYPDLLAGVLLLILAGGALTAQAETPAPRWFDRCLPAALAFLPWLHVKYTALALTALVWHSFTLPWKRSALHAAALAASLALFAGYNQYAFGKPTGPYSQGALLAEANSLIVFIGLHLDQAQGMFLQQPLWLLGLVGLVPMWRASRATGIGWTLLYLGAIAPNAMHPNWYGGYSYIGRFGETAVLLWAIPLAFAARTWFAVDLRIPALLAGGAFALQLCLAGNWFDAGRDLMNQCGRSEIWRGCAWCYGGFVPASLRSYLPYWRPDVEFWRYPANFSALFAAGGLLLVGLFSPRWPKLAALCLLATALGAALPLLLPHYDSMVICAANEFPVFAGRKGRTVETRHIAEEGVDGEGIVAFFPGFSASPGEYRVTVDHEAQGTTGPVGQVMFFDGNVLSVLSSLNGEDGPQRNVSQLRQSRVDKEKQPCIVIYYNGRGTLSIARLAVERCLR